MKTKPYTSYGSSQRTSTAQRQVRVSGTASKNFRNDCGKQSLPRRTDAVSVSQECGGRERNRVVLIECPGFPDHPDEPRSASRTT